MRTLARWLAPGILPLAFAAGPALTRHPAAVIAWRPDPPVQGSLVLLILTPVEKVRHVTGTLVGEPLHFEPDGRGAYVALGGIPLAARDTLPLYVSVEGIDTVTPLPVAHRTVTREALRTAPRFTQPPDSALADRLEHERALVSALLARTHETPRLWAQPFARPRPGAIRSDFGLEREFNGVVESRHLGVDFAGRRGAPVRAANRGVVALVADHFYAGRVVYVDHGAGLLTAYLHLQRAVVAPGDTVERGQMIGRVGATGRVTGPHLHWLARYGKVAVDPMDLLTLDLTPLVQ